VKLTPYRLVNVKYLFFGLRGIYDRPNPGGSKLGSLTVFFLLSGASMRTPYKCEKNIVGESSFGESCWKDSVAVGISLQIGLARKFRYMAGSDWSISTLCPCMSPRLRTD
jgi:hypothetical protein